MPGKVIVNPEFSHGGQTHPVPVKDRPDFDATQIVDGIAKGFMWILSFAKKPGQAQSSDKIKIAATTDDEFRAALEESARRYETDRVAHLKAIDTNPARTIQREQPDFAFLDDPELGLKEPPKDLPLNVRIMGLQDLPHGTHSLSAGQSTAYAHSTLWSITPDGRVYEYNGNMAHGGHSGLTLRYVTRWFNGVKDASKSGIEKVCPGCENHIGDDEVGQQGIVVDSNGQRWHQVCIDEDKRINGREDDQATTHDPQEELPSDREAKSLWQMSRFADQVFGETSTWTYHINLDERGSFYADVRNPSGKTMFEIKAGNELPEGTSSIFDDGYMKHKHDIDGLKNYLVEIGIMSSKTRLIDDATKKTASANEADLVFCDICKRPSLRTWVQKNESCANCCNEMCLCKNCGKPTHSTGTKLCNGCWEAQANEGRGRRHADLDQTAMRQTAKSLWQDARFAQEGLKDCQRCKGKGGYYAKLRNQGTGNTEEHFVNCDMPGCHNGKYDPSTLCQECHDANGRELPIGGKSKTAQHENVQTTDDKPKRCGRCSRPVTEDRDYCIPCERRMDNGPVSRMLWRARHPKPAKEAKILPDDGIADGGERYTNEELALMDAQDKASDKPRKWHVVVTFDDNDIVETTINGTQEEIRHHYLDNDFTLADESSTHRGVNVKFVEDLGDVPWTYWGESARPESARQAKSLWDVKK